MAAQRDASGKFVKASAAPKVSPKGVQHPALRPRKRPKKLSDKQRRTTVRVAKLINVNWREEMAPKRDADGAIVKDANGEVAMEGTGKLLQIVNLVQVPIEISTNNRGTVRDPSGPLRFYLEKGFEWPHEFDPEKYPGIYCAVRDCWDWALVTEDPNLGTERCATHEQMYRQGLIRYNEGAAKEYVDR